MSLSTSLTVPPASPVLTSAQVKRAALEAALEDSQTRLAVAPSDFERNRLQLGIGMMQVLLGNLSETAPITPIPAAGLERFYTEAA